MDGAKYREILEGNLFQSSRDLRLGQRFTFQQDDDPLPHCSYTTVTVYEMASYSLYSALPYGSWSKVVHYTVNRVPFPT
jgi:hypothetical protein